MDEIARLTIRVDERDATRAAQAQRALATETGKAEQALAKQAGAATQDANAQQMLGTAIGQTTNAAAAEARAMLAAAQAHAKAEQGAQRLVATAKGPLTKALDSVKSSADSVGVSAAGLSVGLGLIGGVVGARAASKLMEVAAAAVRMADGYQIAATRIRLVSSSTENAAAVQDRLVALAVATRSPLDDIVKTYSRISSAASEFGASQNDVLRATQAIAQTFTLSGASAAEAAASGTQLAQALGSGTLAGDELKSILESNLVLAQSIAAGFGVTTGALKKMGAEGKLTSEGVFRALLSQADALGAKAGSIAPTVSSGMQTLKTGTTAFVGQLDSALGVTRLIGQAFDSIGRAIAGIDVAGFFERTGRMASGNQAGRVPVAPRLTLEQSQARDAALKNPAFAPAGFRPGGNGFGYEFGQSELTLGGTRTREVRTFGAGEAAAGQNDLAKLFEEKTDRAREAAREAAARAREAAQKAEAASDALLASLVRRFTAFGNGLTVQSEVLPLQHENELQKAIARYGKNSDVVASLMQAQAAELAALGAKIAEQQRATRLQGRLADLQLRPVRAPDAAPSGAAIVAADRAPVVAALDRAEAAAKKAEEQASQISQAFKNSMQQAFASGIEDLAARGLRSFQTFFDSLKSLALRTLSEILASRAMGVLTQLMSGRGAGVAPAGGVGGVVGSLALPKGIGGADKLGNVAKDAAVASSDSASSLFKGATALAKGATSLPGIGLAAGAGALGFAVGRNNGKTVGAGAGALAGAATGAMIGSVVPVLGTAIGGIIGGAAGLIGGLLGGQKRAQQAKKLAEAARSATDDLTVRFLAATGQDAEAQRKRLELQQAAERKEYETQFGRASKVYSDLLRTQAAEMKQLADNAQGVLGPGTYMGPAGFSAGAYRFEAGRPAAAVTGPTITGPITINVPHGTTAEQARDFLREIDRMSSAQGLPSRTLPYLS